jgi:hypothetical protein
LETLFHDGLLLVKFLHFGLELADDFVSVSKPLSFEIEWLEVFEVEELLIGAIWIKIYLVL